MFKSLGNLAVNPHVGLLFIAMHDKPKRLRVNGDARISRDDPLLQEIAGAQLIVRIAVGCDLPELPALHPVADDDRTVGVRAATGHSPGRAGVEEL